MLKRWLMRIGKGLAALLVAGLVVVALFICWVKVSDGPRPDISDLTPQRVAIPDSENGFIALGGTAMPRSESDMAMVKIEYAKPDQWNQAMADAVLARHTTGLARLDKAMALPGFQFEQYTMPQQPLTYLYEIQQLGELKDISARSRWKQGDQHAAIEENFELLEFGHRVTNGGGVWIHFLLGVSMEAKAVRNFQRFAADAPAQREEDLKSAIVRLASYEDHTQAFITVEKTEEESDQVCLMDPDKKYLWYLLFPPRRYNPLFRKVPLPFQQNDTLQLFADANRQVIRDAALTYDKIDKEPGMLKSFDNMSKTGLLLSPNAMGRVFFRIYMPPAVHVASKRCLATTAIRMARALLATRCYWLDHGRLPATLDDVVPAYLDTVPLDEFDGKPLRYSPASKVIYSVGTDGVDHGGSTDGEHRFIDKQPALDIAW